MTPQHDGPAPRTMDCPSLEKWGLFCARQLPVPEAAALIAHAGDCAACGGLLADMAETQGEVAPRPALRSATPSWQRDMLARLEPEPKVIRFQWRWPVRTTWAAAAAVVLMAFVPLLSPVPSLWLLSHSGDRTLEYRLKGEPYRPVASQRGASSSENAALLVVRLLTILHDKTGLEGAGWFQVHGRISLRQGGGSATENAAIDALALAQSETPADTAVANDLAVALLLRSQNDTHSLQSKSQDAAQAITVLENALRLHQDPVLYFNLALAYERLQTYSRAAETWNLFLNLEPAGGWADEGRRHLQRIQVRQQGRATTRARRSEDSIFTLATQGFQPSSSLDPAALAGDLLTVHGDPWLRDFLHDTQKPSSDQGIAFLRQAVQAASTGDASTGAAMSRLATGAFERAGNTPGASFAAYELAYSLQKLSRAEDCIATAAPRLREAAERRYRWLEIQLGLTIGSCQGIARQFAAGYQTIRRAESAAKDAGYPSLYLRSQGMASGLLREVGSYSEALPFDTAGVEQYWAGEGTRSGAYQSYYGLAIALDGMHYAPAAAAAMEEAVAVAAALPERAQEAMARARYADILIENDRLSDAVRELDASESSFKHLPDTPAVFLYRWYARLSNARLMGQRGDTERGLLITAELEAQPGSLENPAIATQLWSVKSELLSRAGRLAESEVALDRLLAIGESARAAAPADADRAALARRVSDAIGLLADRYLHRGDPDQAWRIWTHYNSCFTAPELPSEKTARIVYALLPSGSFALLSTFSGVHAVPLTSAEDVARIAAELRPLLMSPGSSLNRIRALGRRLNHIVLEPLQPFLAGTKQLDIAAASPFATVPFAALVDVDGRWLEDRYALTYSLPTGSIEPLHDAAITSDLRLLSVDYGEATDVLGVHLPSLSSELAEEGRSAALFFRQHSTLENREATLPAVLQNLPLAQAFQFSGHAITVANDAGLVLASGETGGEDRMLWTSRLPRETVRNLRLAVLAACSTGRKSDGTYYQGADMARAFLLAGVPMVLASNWDVDSAATSTLIRTFYDDLGRGLAPDIALTQSAAVLRNQERFAHPYYWAAFAFYRR